MPAGSPTCRSTSGSITPSGMPCPWGIDSMKRGKPSGELQARRRRHPWNTAGARTGAATLGSASSRSSTDACPSGSSSSQRTRTTRPSARPGWCAVWHTQELPPTSWSPPTARPPIHTRPRTPRSSWPASGAANLRTPSRCLRLPRGYVSSTSPTASLAADELVGLLRHEIESGGRTGERTLLVAPWRGDGHGDHEAAGHAAAQLAAELNLPLLEYPVWLWHWATPDSPEVPWDQLTVLDLAGDEQTLKQSALLMHASQTTPLSDESGRRSPAGPGFLEHFTRGFETFIPTPASGVFERLHAGSDDPWGLQDRFYERRKRSVALALLPRERFVATLELGCSIGVLSAELAARSDSLLALDISPTAVAATHRRLAGFPWRRPVWRQFRRTGRRASSTSW